MEILSGNFYFLSDEFFEKVQDPYLKKNYDITKRPHYFAFRDDETGLYWLVPCSSRVEKYEKLIQKKQELHKPTDTIQIIKLFNKKAVLLFQDMFPVTRKYIEGLYVKRGQVVKISNPNQISGLEKTAKKICKILHKGVRFTPTQPDVLRIERIMLEELK